MRGHPFLVWHGFTSRSLSCSSGCSTGDSTAHGPWIVAAALRLWLSGAVFTPERLAPLAVLLPLLVLCSGCASAVTGRIQPSHFRFTTTVPQRTPGPGGWRVACVHAQIKNGDTKEVYTCSIGVEMPMESNSGPISTALAQRIAADCANEAAYTVLSTLTTPPPPPLYTLCAAVREAYNVRLKGAVLGSRVKAICDPMAKPVVFGVPAPGF